MEIQIILLLFAFRTISAQLMNIPPPPTLPDLDISSFPEYMQRLLANRPSVISVDKLNNHEAGKGNVNILHDQNYQNPVQNIGIPRTNGMNPTSHQEYSLNRLNNVKSEPVYVPHALRKPHTYGMHLRGDKGEIWNHVSGNHLYVDLPSKSGHLNFLHNKEDEPNHREQNNQYKQELPSVTSVKPEYLETTSQIIPEEGPAITESPKDKNINNSYHSSISSFKSDFLYYVPQSLSEEIPNNVEIQKGNKVNHNENYHQNAPSTSTPKPVTLYYTTAQPLSEEIPNNVEVQKDKNVNHNDDSHQNFPSILTSKPEIYYSTNQPLSEEIPAIVDYQGSAVNSKENENSVEFPKESNGNTISKDKIEQSFDATIGSNKENKIYQSPKTFGMHLTGDHGYVWNDLTSPGIHYNVGELEISDTTNPIPEEEMYPFEILRRRKEDTPSNNMIPELDDQLKKDIKKFIKKEVARQLEKAFNKIDADRNNGSENNNGGDVEGKEDETNNDNKSDHNNYGSIIGNGKITNVFVFYPNDKNKKSVVSDNSILSKPVNEILNDMLNKDTNKNKPDRDVSIPAGPNQQNTILTNPTNMRFEKFKENDITTQTTEATSKVDVTTVESAPKDQDNQTTQNATAEDVITKAKTDESTTINSIGSSIDDESTTAKESSIEDIKTEATLTESSSTEPIKNSSVQENDSNNETASQATLSNEEVELTTEESNNTNESEKKSTDELNEIEDQHSNETQATPNINNEDAESTSISTNAEDANAVTPDDNVTSEGTVKVDPSEDVTTEATAPDALEQ